MDVPECQQLILKIPSRTGSALNLIGRHNDKASAIQKVGHCPRRIERGSGLGGRSLFDDLFDILTELVDYCDYHFYRSIPR
jgi:hypothetical protein